MKESLVQWTLLQNLEFLSRQLNFEIASKRGQEITTDFGRIDFILEDSGKRQLIVELETTLNTKDKLNYCFNQILNYRNVSFTSQTEYCLLYADETSAKSKNEISAFAKANGIIEKTYSLNDVKKLYISTVERLSLSFGLALPKPANYTICYLRWLNKILKPFKDLNRDILTTSELAHYFTSARTTNFKCYLKLALDFEMIIEADENYGITENGSQYTSNFNPDIDYASNLSSIELTTEQKKIILRIVTNGYWTSHKVNIYWFLRFLEVTNGEWLPNVKDIHKNKLDLANGLFGVVYKSRTMYEFLSFACNWCMELGLVERIKFTSHYDKVYTTPLGVEINNIFSLDLLLKRNRLNLSFKYLD